MFILKKKVKKQQIYEKIKYKKLKEDIREKNVQKFSDLSKIEEDFLLEK